MLSWSVESSITSRLILQLEVFILAGSLKSQGTITSEEKLNPVLKSNNSTSSNISERDQGVDYKIWSTNIYWGRDGWLVLAILAFTAPVSTALWIVNATIFKEAAFGLFVNRVHNRVLTRAFCLAIVNRRSATVSGRWELECEVSEIYKRRKWWSSIWVFFLS